nr:transposase, mutator type [Tanacetum cinerariifolium]
ALKAGFKPCKRELLGLDGAFMRGPFPSQLLFAMSIDSNNGIYPLAYAVVEDETKESWTWNLLCLLDDLGLEENSNLTFIRKAKFEVLLNKMCEVFNGKIVGGRHKPIITALMYVIEYCMKRIVNVVIGKSVGPLTPTTTHILDLVKKSCGNVGHNKTTCLCQSSFNNSQYSAAAKGNSQNKDTPFGTTSQPNERQTQPNDGGRHSHNVAPNGESQSQPLGSRKKLVPKMKNNIASQKKVKMKLSLVVLKVIQKFKQVLLVFKARIKFILEDLGFDKCMFLGLKENGLSKCKDC